MSASGRLEPPTDWEPPVRTIIVAYSQRSGSNLLCSLLGETGLLGRPEHFFHKLIAEEMLGARHTDVAERLRLPNARGRTPNGICAFKMSHKDIDEIGGRTEIGAWYPNPIWIKVGRHDLLGQAISLVKAVQSRQFRSTRESVAEVRYDAAEIESRLRILAEQDAGWRLFFARNGIDPIPVFYEDLVSDPRRVLLGIGRAAGVDLADAAPRLEQSSLKQQSDGSSRDWRERFVATYRDQTRFDRLCPGEKQPARWFARFVARK